MEENNHIYPIFDKMLMRKDKEDLLKQHSVMVWFTGLSGSGKSTIARMLTHLEGVTEGKIFLKGKDITHVGGKALRNIYQDMQMVFQMPMESFDPRRTLGDGIGESLRNMGISRAETRKRVENLCERRYHPFLTD